jgi:peptidoglycan/xylan/chitin deacetylase (PgdA/CDA1 family)
MSTPGRTSSKSAISRINTRWPWLKLYFVLFIGLVAILDLMDLTISKSGDPLNKIRVAPMSRHVRATERILDGKKLVVLTFDDGPAATTTPRLLDILSEKDVPATFFMLGNMARNNPDIVKRAKKEGHEVASHTMYHQNLIRISASAARSDIDEAKNVITGVLGASPRFTRPPYGNYNSVVAQAVGTPMILWSVDTLDWKSRNVDSIISTAMAEVHDGAIILMHDVYDTTVDAVPRLIDTLRQDGYEFATLDEITKIRDISLANGEAYYSFRP